MFIMVCVWDVVVYVQLDFMGKIYGYIVKLWLDILINCDFCLRDYVVGLFRWWWSWKIRGNLYIGKDLVLGRYLDMQVGVNYNCVFEKGYLMRCKSFMIKILYKVFVSVVLNNYLYYFLYILYILYFNFLKGDR